jgi:hypothetical protein
LRWYLEILNVYNSKNVTGYDYSADYTSRKEIKQLPFLPYAGVEVKVLRGPGSPGLGISFFRLPVSGKGRFVILPVDIDEAGLVKQLPVARGGGASSQIPDHLRKGQVAP